MTGNGDTSMLRMVLGKFLALQGVSAAFVLREDGRIVDLVSTESINAQDLGLRLSETVAAADAIAAELGDRAFTMSFCEFGDSFLLATPLTGNAPLNEKTYIAVIAERDANIGRVRYELKKNKDLIISVL